MLYVIAQFFPPLALLLCGKIFQAIFNFLLMITFVGWFFAIIWAILVVANHYADRRIDRLIKATQQGQAMAADASQFGASVGRKSRYRDPSIEVMESWATHDHETEEEAKREQSAAPAPVPNSGPSSPR